MRVSVFGKSVTALCCAALCWQAVFFVLYVSTILGWIGEWNPNIAGFIMNGAGVCGVVMALTCYFPWFWRHRFQWTGDRLGIPVAISFVLLFIGLGVSAFVVTAHWIGSM